MRALTFGLIFVLACGSDDDGSESGGEDLPAVTGSLTPEGEGLDGAFDASKAFAWNAQGRLIAYVSSNPRATCESVTNYLQVGSDPFDPVDVIKGGHCNVFLLLGDGYDGGLVAVGDPNSDEIDVVGAGTSIECALGEGEFVYETRDGDDTDYYWSGRWWQGHPLEYTFDISGGDGDPFIFDIEMSTYDGGFIYEEFSNTPATGDVSGQVIAEWCDGLSTTGLF